MLMPTIEERVERFTPAHAHWPAYLAHLHRAGDARWVLDASDQPNASTHFLGIQSGNEVIANLTLKHQPITLLPTDETGGESRWLTGPDGLPLDELFVQTFTVEQPYRRRGYGTALQCAALDLAAELGCHQLRSWSSSDRQANYALKIKLGFAAHPAIFTTDSGLRVSGVYFVKTVQKESCTSEVL
jgi:GNAT superfamily N-acetyltransferase